MAKNRANAPIIMQGIEARVAELLSLPIKSTSFLDTLAHTQSLVLYQIIRLFDGDIAVRAAAERTIPDLEESVMYLLARVRFDVALESDFVTVVPTRAAWRDWIMHESGRRTALFCFFFLQVYRLLAGSTDLTCDARLGLCHSWTVSRHLWTAGTLADFARAWRGRKHFVVRDARFDPVLLEATADDVDRFGKMFISTLIGVDEAEVWFESRGGRLRDS